LHKMKSFGCKPLEAWLEDYWSSLNIKFVKKTTLNRLEDNKI